MVKVAKRIGRYSADCLRMAKARVNKPTVLAKQSSAGMWKAVDLVVRLNSDEAKEAMRAFALKSKKGKEAKLYVGIWSRIYRCGMQRYEMANKMERRLPVQMWSDIVEGHTGVNTCTTRSATVAHVQEVTT